MNNIKKLGLGIVCFDASEHLYNIISEIRDLVDYVVVGLQSKSYTGDPIDPNDVYEVETLKKEGLVDNILYIDDIDSSLFARVQETIKRNKLIDDIAAHGCTHDLIIDSDEYYNHDPFKAALEKIDKYDYQITYCRYINYYHDYLHYLVYPFKDGNYVPFVTRVKYHFNWQSIDFPKPSDPTRRYERPKVYKVDPITHRLITKEVILPDKRHKFLPIIDHYTVGFHEFDWNELKMHHFSWLRNNIRKKLNEWTCKSYFKDYYATTDKAIDCFNNFNEENEIKTATLLFNVPGNKIDIETLPKQYVNPKVDFHTRAHHLPKPKTIRYIRGNTNLLKLQENLKEEYIVITNKNNIHKNFISKIEDDSIIYCSNIKETLYQNKTIKYPSGDIIISKETLVKIVNNSHINDKIKDIGLKIGLIMNDYYEKINLTHINWLQLIKES